MSISVLSSSYVIAFRAANLTSSVLDILVTFVAFSHDHFVALHIKLFVSPHFCRVVYKCTEIGTHHRALFSPILCDFIHDTTLMAMNLGFLSYLGGRSVFSLPLFSLTYTLAHIIKHNRFCWEFFFLNDALVGWSACCLSDASVMNADRRSLDAP